MKKGDICEGVIERYDFPNKGSLTVDDRKVTIKGALEGQKVRFMITKKKAGIAEGRLLEVLEPSPLEDATPMCEYFGLCGGCTYQTMSYENQLKLKEAMVRKILDPVLLKDGMTAEESYGWEGICKSPIFENYRNKMEFTFGDEYRDGPLALGLHKKGGFYDILNVENCKIINADWGRILRFSVDYFKEKNVPFYHKMRHTGVLRNLVVRQSKATGEFLINLVAADQWAEAGFNKDEILEGYKNGLVELEKTFEAGKIAGILYTKNDTLGDVVACDELTLLYGKDYITEEIIGLSFVISPFSFFQTNTKGCEVLYNKAREYVLSGSVMDENAQGAKEKILFDLYSGTGTIAQMMAAVSKKVIGIEIVEEAVEAAKKNALRNGLSNCEFIAGDVLKAIDLVEDKPDMIILDPPRDGINPKALEKILDFGVDEMVYISCKPTSLARDLVTITSRGYKVARACCVDQFPGTVHVESIVKLELK